MDLKYYLPLLLVIFSNVIYHNVAKNTPNNANTFLSLAIAYGVGMIITTVLYFATGKKLVEDIQQINWTSFVLGFAIVGIEIGYILMYRVGWKISSGSLIASVTVALCLILVGKALYQEVVTLRKLVGIGCCIIGLFLINYD